MAATLGELFRPHVDRLHRALNRLPEGVSAYAAVKCYNAHGKGLESTEQIYGVPRRLFDAAAHSLAPAVLYLERVVVDDEVEPQCEEVQASWKMGLDHDTMGPDRAWKIVDQVAGELNNHDIPARSGRTERILRVIEETRQLMSGLITVQAADGMSPGEYVSIYEDDPDMPFNTYPGRGGKKMARFNVMDVYAAPEGGLAEQGDQLMLDVGGAPFLVGIGTTICRGGAAYVRVEAPLEQYQMDRSLQQAIGNGYHAAMGEAANFLAIDAGLRPY
jgi:hypothetical protein